MLPVDITRFSPAQLFCELDIPYVIWAEEALWCAHNVPTLCFKTLTLLVPERDLTRAILAIPKHLNYQEIDVRPGYFRYEFRPPPPPDAPLLPEKHKFKLFFKFERQDQDGNDRPRCEAAYILLIVDDFFEFDVTDANSRMHVAGHDKLWFPTKAAVFDACIFARRTLPIKYGTAFERMANIMSVHVGYILQYSLIERQKDSDDEADDDTLDVKWLAAVAVFIEQVNPSSRLFLEKISRISAK